MTTLDPKTHQILAGLAQQARYVHDFAKSGRPEEALEHAGAVERLLTSWRLAAGHAEPAESRPVASRAELEQLVQDLTQSEPCEIDHNGGCQAHWWFPEHDTPCPHGRAQTLFPDIKE